MHINLLHFITCISIDVVTLMSIECIDRQKGRQLSTDRRVQKLLDDSISIVMEQCNARVLLLLQKMSRVQYSADSVGVISNSVSLLSAV